MTKPWYRRVPWLAVKEGVYLFRVGFASQPKPEQEHIIADAGVEELSKVYRKSHYRTGWFLSYHYHGEDANLCRPEYIERDGTPNCQTHIRLFGRDDGRTEILPHVEVCPIAHPKLHLKEEFYSVSRGVEKAHETLHNNGIQYEVVRP